MKVSFTRVLATSLLLGLAIAAPSCGGTTSKGESGGTDSNTHWLDVCTNDSDCGALDCVCGICTKRCADEDACASLSEAASCAEPGTCAAPDSETACVLVCGDATDCPGSTFQCVDGQCQREPKGESDAGAPDCSDVNCTTDDCQAGFEEYVPPGECCKICRPNCSGVDCAYAECPDGFEDVSTEADCCPICQPISPNDPCRPMDARDDGTDCASIAGYAYDGTDCYPINCGCTGQDCDEMFEKLATCAQAHAECAPMVSTECAADRDCAVTHAGCCSPCGAPSIDESVSLSAGSVDAYHTAACASNGDCPFFCAGFPNPTIYPVCGGGTCAAIDAGPFADCATDDDCSVRARECCECGADLGSLVAVSDPSGYGQSVCDDGQACDACAPIYPDDVRAVCDTGRCVLE